MKTIPEEDCGVQAQHNQLNLAEPRTSSEPAPGNRHRLSEQKPSVSSPPQGGVNGFHKSLPGEPSSRKAITKKKGTSVDVLQG